LFILALSLTALIGYGWQSSPDPTWRLSNVRMGEAYGKLPLSFEANHGQTDRRVKFFSRGDGYGIFLTPTEVVFQLRVSDRGSREGRTTRALAAVVNPQDAIRDTRFSTLRMRLGGANETAKFEGLEVLPGRSHYLIGRDPRQWRTDVAHYGRVRYREVYPGIDLIYHGNQRQLEYDLVVAPGADPARIKLAFDGAHQMKMDENGDLVLRQSEVELRHHRPVIYQEVDGVRRIVEGQFVVKGKREIGFAIGAYDRNHPLVIDPVLSYSTFLGGMGEEAVRAIAVDAAGNAYLTGVTSSLNFPSANPTGVILGGGVEAFVAKLNPTGTALVYSSYYGGKRLETGTDIAVDAAGNAYLLGITNSTDFPTTSGAFQTSLPNGNGISTYVSKLNPAGNAFVYSTYLGGPSGEDFGICIAIDSSGNAYIAGIASQGFPTTPNAYRTLAGFNFLAKLNSAGNALAYSTFFGDSLSDGKGAIITDMAVDTGGNAYITGIADKNNFPTTPGAYQRLPSDSSVPVPDLARDAFITKFNATGTALVYSTLLGGSSLDVGTSIALDALGNAYVAGVTGSPNFPTTTGAFQKSKGDPTEFIPDGFVTKLNPQGSALVYSTFLGGSLIDVPLSIAVDAAGNAHITGITDSSDFPITSDLSQLQAERGGVFRTTNGGGNWSIMNNGLNSPAVHSLVVDPKAPSNVYAGTFGGGVFKSTDGGGSWSPANNGLSNQVVISLAIDPVTTSTLYAGTALGLFKSTNGGGSWSAINNLPLGPVLSIAIDPVNPAVLYIGLFREKSVNGIYKSINGGSSWALTGLSMEVALALAIDPKAPSTIYAATVNGIFKSINGGSSWSIKADGLTANVFLAIAIDPINTSTLYAATVTAGVIKSTDGGDTWSPVNNGLPDSYSIAGFKSIVAFTLAIDPATPSTIYVSTFSGGVFKSTNGGGNWSAVNTGLNSRQIFALAIDRNSPTTVYSGGDSLMDGFVTKLNPQGSGLVYSGYIGGNGLDLGLGIAVDGRGGAYLLGMTTSRNFPVTPNVVQSAFGGGVLDTFIAKLSPPSTDPAPIIVSISPPPALGPVAAGQEPNSNPVSGAFFVENKGTTQVTVNFASLLRTGSDVDSKKISDPDDRAIFAIRVINTNGSETSVDFGAPLTIPAGQKINLRVLFNPLIPPLSGRTSGLSANQAVPDVINSLLTLGITGADSIFAGLLGRVTTPVKLIHPFDPRRPPLVLLARNGDEMTVEASVHDTNLDLYLIRYQFLDNAGRAVGGPIDVDLVDVIRQTGLVRGQSFSIIQKFTGGGNRPEITKVQVTVYDREASSSASSGSPGSGESVVASVSAASFSEIGGSAESIIAAFGSGLATSTQTATTTPLPTSLAGTTVRIRDGSGSERLAPLFFVSPNQINYLIPDGTAPGAATVTVVRGNISAAIGLVQVHRVAPALFAANANGQGVSAAVILRVKSDGTQQYEPVAQFDAVQNRFVTRAIDLGPPGDQVFLILFGTGIRQGLVTRVTIGGEDAPALFAGPQGGFAGLDQINVRVQRSLTKRGELDVALTANGLTSNSVKIRIASGAGIAESPDTVVGETGNVGQSGAHSETTSTILLPTRELPPAANGQRQNTFRGPR
jgi:uncharacterized protein (TIGR03437 family)